MLLVTTKIEKCLKFAYIKHKGQVDKANVNYIYHPIKVASYFNSEHLVVVSLLHDVLEDTNTTINDLFLLGLSNDEINDIMLVTKKNNERYEGYLKRFSKSINALKVKSSDSNHNSMLDRFVNPTKYDYEKCDLYRTKRDYLLTIINEKEKFNLDEEESFINYQILLDLLTKIAGEV